MKRSASKPHRTRIGLAAALAVCTVLAACSSAPDGGEVAADTIGLARERPGRIVLAEDARTVATPYGGLAGPVTCETAARDIVRLTLLLGPDIEAPEPERTDAASERGAAARSRQFASDISDDLPELAVDAAVDTVVGLNPARPVVRLLAQSGETEAAARRERELALKRRAWLRGAFDALGCEREALVRALASEGSRAASAP